MEASRERASGGKFQSLTVSAGREGGVVSSPEAVVWPHLGEWQGSKLELWVLTAHQGWRSHPYLCPDWWFWVFLSHPITLVLTQYST